MDQNQTTAPIIEEGRQHLMELFHLVIAAQQRSRDAGNAARGQRLGAIAGNLKDQDRLIKALNMGRARSLKVK